MIEVLDLLFGNEIIDEEEDEDDIR